MLYSSLYRAVALCRVVAHSLSDAGRRVAAYSAPAAPASLFLLPGTVVLGLAAGIASLRGTSLCVRRYCVWSWEPEVGCLFLRWMDSSLQVLLAERYLAGWRCLFEVSSGLVLRTGGVSSVGAFALVRSRRSILVLLRIGHLASWLLCFRSVMGEARQWGVY